MWGELGLKRSVGKRRTQLWCVVVDLGVGACLSAPGRDERTAAILELLSGKATVDQVAFRFGVHPKTVERWREVALEGIERSMRQGSGKSKREKELEGKLKALERAFTDLAIRHELVERALSERPTRPLSAPGRREVSQMSRETSRGKACVRQLCKAFGVSP